MATNHWKAALSRTDLFKDDRLQLFVLPPVPGVDRGCDGVDGGLGLGDRDPVSVVDRHAQELAFSAGVADLQVPGVIPGVGGDQGRDDQKGLKS